MNSLIGYMWKGFEGSTGNYQISLILKDLGETHQNAPIGISAYEMLVIIRTGSNKFKSKITHGYFATNPEDTDGFNYEKVMKYFGPKIVIRELFDKL